MFNKDIAALEFSAIQESVPVPRYSQILPFISLLLVVLMKVADVSGILLA